MSGSAKKLFLGLAIAFVMAVGLLVFIFTSHPGGPQGMADRTVGKEGAKPSVKVERVVSPGGIEAWLVVDRTNPIISLRLSFRGGASLDPAGKEGLTEMVSALLDEGAGDLDSEAFQRRLEDLAMELRFEAGRDGFGGRMKTLSEHRDAAFEMLRLALNAPRFDAEPIERMRSQLLAGLRRDLEEPDTIAQRRLAETLFPGHPYGRPVEGTPDSINAIGVEDIRRFARERFARDNLTIGFVGDIDSKNLGRLLDKTFSGLPQTSAPADIADVRPLADGSVVTVDMDVPQSAIIFAQQGLKRDDPEFFTAYVMNHILGGGGFTARLYEEVREKRGLAYSIGSYLYPLRHSAVLLGSAGTANARAGETVKLIREEWRRMAAEGVTPDELGDAKTYLTGSFPLRFTSSDTIASILVGMQTENLGIDYLEKRNSHIEAVTVEGVRRLAARLLDPDRLKFVIVGKPEGL